ncbi:hypothetical protein WJX82_005828 [Trebouxia sp. C0006]
MRAPCARSCSSQCTSTSGRHAVGRWEAFVPLQGPVRSTLTQHARRDFAVHALGVESRRVTYQDTVFDSEEEIVPPTAEEGKQYAIQYQQLKKEMLGRTQRFGGLLAAYLFLTVSGQAALCALLGSGAGYAYLVLLQQQVDSVTPTDAVPIWEAEDNIQGFARPFAIAIAAYRAGLRARLLVPVGLGACVWACNQSGLHTVTRVEEGCLILGFLSFKAALLLNVWDSLKPKFDPEAFKRPPRPVQYNFDEEPNIDDIMDNIASVRKIGGKKF